MGGRPSCHSLSTQTSVARGGYDDDVHADGNVTYRFMRESTTDAPATNRALVTTASLGLPVIYLIEVGTSVYEPVLPVWLQHQTPGSVTVSGVPPIDSFGESVVDLRQYSRGSVQRRLHQEHFRARVLFAYEDRCCICRLRRRGLLDAAHIVDDVDEAGLAIVPNGLALCRIHHGAYDQFMIGIRPDLVVEVARDVLDEEDGPMLRHGLQAFAGAQIVLPASRSSRPDPDRLEWKFERFRSAS